MSNTVLIIGESGVGKSTSIRNLDPKETFIINVLGKPMPFMGGKKNYINCDKDNPSGNHVATDKTEVIKGLIMAVNDRRPEIKTLIIDDFNYTMTNEFMRQALIKGFDKFSLIAQNAWSIINCLNATRDDLDCFVLMHSDTDQDGKSKPMTIGKLINDKVKLEGMVTTCLHALIIDGEYKFLTQNDGCHMSKSPYGMFKDGLIDNDLTYVKQQLRKYLNEDINS
jgi:ABC-type dipeptide/oligopeptide/nickel transport system ATPase component